MTPPRPAPRALVALLATTLLLSRGARAALLVEPWGRDSLRVRVAPGDAAPADIPTALLAAPPPAPPSAGAAFSRAGSSYSAGNLRLDITAGGAHQFSRVSDGRALVALAGLAFSAPLPFHSLPQAAATFGVGGAELFGLGQFREACYPQGGLQTPALGRVFAPGAVYSIDISRGEGGAANSLPWLMGATVGAGADFGVWLNVPAMGAVSFDARDAANRSVTWSLAAAAQLDYVVTTTGAGAAAEASAFDLLANFVSWVGPTPQLPEWALGYWHSKARYASQADLLAAAHGFFNRSVPVDIIVIDWLHWKVQGDWHFDASFWPDPTAMVAELATLNMRVMVTVWPWSHNGSLTYDHMLANNFFVQPVAGTLTPDGGACPQGELCPPQVVTMPDGLHGSLVDVTNPAARDYVWGQVVDGYVKHGIQVFWLDSSEPEYFNFPQWGQVHWQNATYENATLGFAERGTFAEMGQLFTTYWSQMFANGMRALGAPPLMLARTSYASTWRNGAALWSGDVQCTFPVLATQVRTGLSAQTSGFGLWTTDIGGYDGDDVNHCDITNSTYRELVVRWFQYGVTCPLFRQHGSRDTEIWLYGPEAEAIITALIRWRVSIKAYLAQQMLALSTTGRPINRPLWWDFASDEPSWSVDDEYMFGDDYLAAPVLVAGAVSRPVYLPPLANAAQWRHVFSGQLYAGGATYEIAAPLDSFPLFKRGA